MSTSRVQALWRRLADRVVSMEGASSAELLGAIRAWVEENRRFLGADFAQGRAALSLLLEGKDNQFPDQRPEEAAHGLRHTLVALAPKTRERAANILELAVRRFAVYTAREDCPVCQEGYLGYWVEPATRKFYLRCPECRWQQDLEGNEAHVDSPLFPASKLDLESLL